MAESRRIKLFRILHLRRIPSGGTGAGQQKYISVQRYFEVSLLLMLGTAFLTLAATGKLSPALILLFLGALGIKLWTYARGELGYRLRPRTVTSLSIAYLIFFVFDLLLLGSGGPAQRLLPASVHLVLFITVIKIFSARRYRDYGYLAALSFLMMLVSAVLTADAAYLAGLGLYVIFAISMFISYDIKRGIEKASEPPRGPHASAARNQVAVENSLVLTTLAMAGGIAALGALLFFAIPRYHAAYFSNLAAQTANVTGFSEDVSLGEIGRIKRSSLVVMRVQPMPGPAGQVHLRDYLGVYWRGIGLAHFTGRSWYNQNGTFFQVAPTWPGHFLLPTADGMARRPRRILRYRVLLSSLPTNVLFAAAQPVEVSGRFQAIRLDETGSLHDLRGDEAPVEYTVVSSVGLPTARELRRDAASAPEEILSRYLSLPPLDPRISTLAAAITRSSTTNYDRALDIQNYLRSHFGYTLDPPSIQPSDPVGSFLFVSQKGYCAYFAAAMAVMLRALGVPARVVNGFQTGEYNRVGGDFIVRARDAHSWVEVYFPGYGWIPFDPTPSAGEPGFARSALGDYLDAFSLFWNEWVLNYDFQHQAMLGQRMDQDSHRARDRAHLWAASFEAGTAAWMHSWVHKLSRLKEEGAWLALIIVLLMAVAVLFALGFKRTWPGDWRFLWKFRLKSRGPDISPREASLAYEYFQRLLARKGFHRLPSQTPREFARAVAEPSLAPLASEFTALYNAVRFGHAPASKARVLKLLDHLARAKP